jgi:hypothetical protein
MGPVFLAVFLGYQYFLGSLAVYLIMDHVADSFYKLAECTIARNTRL